MDYILAIDQSTSATKALLFDSGGTLHDSVSAEHEQIYPRPGWVEHDAGEIWSNVLSVVSRLVKNNPERAASICCLSITNQRETFVAFDRHTGVPVGNAIVWLCRRGEPLCTELAGTNHETLIAETTGLKVDTYFSAPKMRWLMEHEPAVRRQAEAGTLALSTIDTYLVHRLTGGRAFVTDFTNACRTLLFDIRTLAWSEELCELFCVPPEALPRVVESTAVVGETDCGGILPHAVPICGIAGDSQASLYAHGCVNPGQAKVTIGTGSSILLNTGADLTRAPDGIVSTLAWVLDGTPTYALEGIINCTGATVAWLRDRLGLIDSSAQTRELAEEVEDNGGVYLVPAFVGLSAPYWRSDARAAIVGMSSHSSRAHVVRAALESIGYQIYDVLGAMGDGGPVLRTLHADGGATANAFLMQFIADITGVSVKASTSPNLSAKGAALLGARGMDLHDGDAGPGGEGKAYGPLMEQQRVSALHRGWQSAVRMVLAGAAGDA
jgi:glycerol kinase